MEFIVKLNHLLDDYKSLPDEIVTCAEINSVMDIIVQDYKKLPQQSPKPITIPEMFHRSYDENFISDFLAYILSPFDNGIGLSPLNSLISYGGNDEIKLLDDVHLKKDINIKREHTFEDGGRIDLLIQIKKEIIIAIENKIYAREGKNQTISYAISIKKEFPDCSYIFFYLSPNKGETPSSKEFIHLSYSDLRNIFFKSVNDKSFHSNREKILFH